jgi:hypothetical protein
VVVPNAGGAAITVKIANARLVRKVSTRFSSDTTISIRPSIESLANFPALRQEETRFVAGNPMR